MSLLNSLLRTDKEPTEVEKFSGNTSPTSPEPVPFHDDAREVPLTAVTWSCPDCSQPLTIDDVCSSLDGERTLTLWRCDPCGVAGVTPDAIRTPPAVWVKTVQQ